MRDKIRGALPELRAQAARIAELEAALKPFAEEWEWANSCGPCPGEWLKEHRRLTWRQYAKAAEILASPSATAKPKGPELLVIRSGDPVIRTESEHAARELAGSGRWESLMDKLLESDTAMIVVAVMGVALGFAAIFAAVCLVALY